MTMLGSLWTMGNRELAKLTAATETRDLLLTCALLADGRLQLRVANAPPQRRAAFKRVLEQTWHERSMRHADVRAIDATLAKLDKETA